MGVLTKQLRQFGEPQLLGASKMVVHNLVLICVFQPKRRSAGTYFEHNSCFSSIITKVLRDWHFLHYSCFSLRRSYESDIFCIIQIVIPLVSSSNNSASFKTLFSRLLNHLGWFYLNSPGDGSSLLQSLGPSRIVTAVYVAAAPHCLTGKIILVFSTSNFSLLIALLNLFLFIFSSLFNLNTRFGQNLLFCFLT